MRRYCAEVDGPKMANLIEGGKTPLLPPAQLEAIGYKIAVYPLTLLNVSIAAMRAALAQPARSERPTAAMDFEELKTAVGFPAVLRRRSAVRRPRRRPARRAGSDYCCEACDVLEEVLRALIELFRRQIFLVGGDRPAHTPPDR